LRKEWYDFRGNRSAADLIFAVQQILEKGWESGRHTYLALINIENARDNISRLGISKTLHKAYAFRELIG
jgi:hypothetical protein